MSKLEDVALKVWRMFRGEVQWAAVPWIAAMYGVDDLEAFAHLLVTIGEHQAENR